MNTRYFILVLLSLLLIQLDAQHVEGDIPTLDNPMTEAYLNTHLQRKSPKIILTPSFKKALKSKIKNRPEIGNYYQAIKLNADRIVGEPLLKRIKTGRRLLSVSREMLYRMGVLSMVYIIEENKDILDRINEELLAVCAFSDWNPSHYLDVAEMSLALAIAVDWVGEDLPKSTVEKVKENLIEKGIKPSYNKKGNTGWVNGTNNWNQVCHAGMIAASIVIADDDPALASKTISRALKGMPRALVEYGPDGVYPEGSTYWGYGTSFSVMTSSMLGSAFGTDFGLADYPAFRESADFRVLCNTPSGWYYNFADCGDKRSAQGDVTLAWFAMHTGNALYYEKDRFMMSPEDMGKLPRIAGPALVWMSQFEAGSEMEAPINWVGRGANPVVIFRGDEQNPDYYFGGKGGRGTVNHGNMDGGSFIFELNGVRWSVDPGNQNYHALEKTGFSLWDRCQECERWSLLTKNNYGHSTLTVNDALHVVDGFADIVDFTSESKPTATIDLTATFAGQLASARRTFTKDSPRSILIEDVIVPDPQHTKVVTWQMMTTADVQVVHGGAVMSQDGQTLMLENISHPQISASIIALDTPPHKLDRVIDGLKRVEIRIPAYLLDDGENKILIRLAPTDE